MLRSFYRLRKASHNTRSAKFQFLPFRRFFHHQFFWHSPKNSPRTMTLQGGQWRLGWVKTFVSWSVCSTVSEGRHTTPEGSKLNSYRPGDIYTTNFFDNRPRTHRERWFWWGGEWWVGMSKKFVLWSDRSTVSARCHTNPEGPKLNSPCSGDVCTTNFFENSPRIHQERCLQRG